MPDFLDDLRCVIRDGEAVLVVGAGVSIGAANGAQVASRKGLLQSGLNYCGERFKKQHLYEELLEGGEIEDYIAAAQALRRKLKAERYWGKWLEETVGTLVGIDDPGRAAVLLR